VSERERARAHARARERVYKSVAFAPPQAACWLAWSSFGADKGVIMQWGRKLELVASNFYTATA
jgi:hypothetical protein